MADLTAGTVFTFRLASGLYGACRVMRAASEADAFRGDWLVCAVTWFGKDPSELKVADAKKTMRTASGPGVYWVKGAPPKTFAKSSIVAKVDTDATRACTGSAPWGIFPNAVHATWRDKHEPDALAADRKKANAEGDAMLAAQVAELKKSDRIDLTGFIPLAIAKKDRTPREVLVGFIAAMNQWEKECARIDAANPGHLAVHMNGDAQAAIFDELCTPKDRKYGRLGSYSSQPEYDPKNETIVSETNVGARRVEIETQRGAPFADRRRYVLVKTKGAWLIDGVKRDGEPAIL